MQNTLNRKETQLVRYSYWKQNCPSHQIISCNQAVTGYFGLLEENITPSAKTKAVAALVGQQIMKLARIIEKNGDTWDGLEIAEVDIEKEIEDYIKTHP